jgi:hypothetical protein
VSSETAATDHAVETYVGVRQQATRESPARIGVSFTNVAAAQRVFWFGAVPPFTAVAAQHETEPAQLQLVPDEGASVVDADEDGELTAVPERPTGGCWQAPDAAILPSVSRFVRLDPCETVSAVFTVVGHPENVGCPPTGTYRVTTTWETAAEPGRTSTEMKVDWTVSLTLSG